MPRRTLSGTESASHDATQTVSKHTNSGKEICVIQLAWLHNAPFASSFIGSSNNGRVTYRFRVRARKDLLGNN
jgi:hypothetical protein